MTNCFLASDLKKSNSFNALHLNLFLINDKKDKAAKLLLKSWEKIIRNILLPKYLERLMEEITMRKKKLDTKINTRNDEYLREEFQNGELYINIDNEDVIYDKPKKIIEWMLTRKEIENISELINDMDEIRRKDGNDKEIMEKAAIKIQQWWKNDHF
ncbi:hypothetical protein LOAG_15864 [Loa loa]|uniref:Uncharacterized protein n=1 Tax=Loa loa TaxID=7209 RepID=A0A1S0TEQ6_LOALO|nr:hypothetical protein LOAG_15864 [Loa loa]EFO12669.1 hypothetical protein LOAG_15864 [Loa loa]